MTTGRRSLNAAIGMSIAYYRDINDPVIGKPHGPFKNLFELMNVPIGIAPPFTGTAITPGTLFKNVMLYSPGYGSTAPAMTDLLPATCKPRT